MCIISGLVNIKREDEEGRELIEAVSKIMLKKMAESNPHGAGIALSYHDHDGIFVLKSPNSGEALSQSLELDKSMAFKHVLLHTRFATQGAINEQNAHPHMGPLGALIHNGFSAELYDAIEKGWHLNAEALQQKLADFNESGTFSSDCDSEALALIFDPDPNEFAKNLTGQEIFAIAHIDHSGDSVALFTQFNTVYMMYSNALESVVFATRKEVLEAVLEYTGEVWPIAQVPHDYVMYFDGNDQTGGHFDFTEKSMPNLEKYYEKYSKKTKKNQSDMVIYDSTGEIIEERDDLDTYFKSALDKESSWKKTVLEDGSIVWENYLGEIIHCDAETVDELEKYTSFLDMPEESEVELADIEDVDEPRRDFLDRDFEKIQAEIQKQIAAGVEKKTS